MVIERVGREVEDGRYSKEGKSGRVGFGGLGARRRDEGLTTGGENRKLGSS